MHLLIVKLKALALGNRIKLKYAKYRLELDVIRVFLRDFNIHRFIIYFVNNWRLYLSNSIHFLCLLIKTLKNNSYSLSITNIVIM